MHLTRITIKNFRNLKNLTVDLGDGLNVLVGPNNAGKTNLFDAIRLSMGAEASRAEPLWLSEDDLYCTTAGAATSPDTPAEPKADIISIQLMFTGLNTDQVSQFFEIVDFQTPEGLKAPPAKINFQAVWQPKTERFQVTRWGGSENSEPSAIPVEILQAIPIVSLPALRNAEEALTPGNKSILARVLEDLARRVEGSHKTDFETIFSDANKSLADQPLVQRFQDRLRVGTQEMSGTSYTRASVQAAEPEFRRILRTLRVILDEAPIKDIAHSGMGYNNLLFVATILSHLEKTTVSEKKAAFECPIVLIEEPEAHLNPQHTLLLGSHLSSLGVPQVLASTHSPTFASHVKPSQIQVLFSRGGHAVCNAIRSSKLGEAEERQLQRMLDVTKATLYFARGIILVEGLSEALLLPEFALENDIDLRKRHISVVPICGVDFGIFAKIFSESCLDIPVALITDSDPPVKNYKSSWEIHEPTIGEKCARLIELEKLFKNRNSVEIFSSSVTLEYDLAKAAGGNPGIMAQIWEDSFVGTPQNFNKKLLEGLNHEEQVLATWRGICRSGTTGSKPDFAQQLATWISGQRAARAKDPGNTVQFKIPDYLVQAIQFVCDKLPS